MNVMRGTPKKKGDDGGCFAAALSAVRTWGGVLEHPEASHAWRTFGIFPPPRAGGWVDSRDAFGGFTCCVEQGHYGHAARKATWLYVCHVPVAALPALRWGKAFGRNSHAFGDGYHSAEERRTKKKIKQGIISTISLREREETPVDFRDVLLSITQSVDTDVVTTGDLYAPHPHDQA